MRKALLLGATGLVGGELLKRLAADSAYDHVVALVRRPLPATPPVTKLEQVVVDYDQPETYRSHLAVDDVFCCLGTTIAKAGSQAAFRRVDLEIPLVIAKASLAAGAKQFLLVSAVGADPKSTVFYSRVKGELETALRELPFPGGLKIFHPSLLLGQREEKRLGEVVGAAVLAVIKPLLIGSWQRYAAISGQQVANAMANVAKAGDSSVKVYQGAELFAAAGVKA